MIDINCKGVVNGLHAAFPALRATGNATVVNLCSASAIYGQPELAVYSATKFAVIGLTKALAKEVATRGIYVNCVTPAIIETELLQQLTPEVVAEHPDAVTQLHREFARAGAEVLQALTFYADDRGVGWTDRFMADVNRRAVALARDSAALDEMIANDRAGSDAAQ